MILYKNFQTAITYNGYISEWFEPSRGIHQGCAISGYIFILNAEILANKIQNHPKVRKIPISDDFIDPVSQFVDDICLFVLAEQETLEIISVILEDFEKNTGLRTNFEKSCIYRLGQTKKQSFKPTLRKKFRWADTGIMALGVLLDHNAKNYEQVFSKAEAVQKNGIIDP